MPIQSYHRPNSIEEALKLLNRPGARSAVVAGGTHLNPNLNDDLDAVIDLQALGLARIELAENRLSLGAMTRLQDIADYPGASVLLKETIRYEAPNTFRNMATIGGLVASCDWESETLAALLVMDAAVEIWSIAGANRVSLKAFLEESAAALENGIITSISLTSDGDTAHERVARTPMDRAIVAVSGRKFGGGEIRLAFSGIAETPILAAPDELESLNPPADFRGSSDYRQRMAITLSQRVISRLA